MTALSALAAGGRYQGYAYAYPHKTAYRAFEPPQRLETLWRDESPEQLFLYAHVPFCEMRCGFCNLFTEQGGAPERVTAYLAALTRQAQVVRAALPTSSRFARLAIGGGTPTLLNPAELDALFELLDTAFDVRPDTCPTSVESSPATATKERLAVLAQRGVERVSIGVQSLVQSELAAMGRPGTAARSLGALDAIRASGIPRLNVDLIYGADGQTEGSLASTLNTVLRFEPEEVFLYPLYVRPLTGLGRRQGAPVSDAAWDAHRARLYEAGRAQLLAAGYEQWSMRMFRRLGRPSRGARYSCQDDGMVGVGAGARSYTQRVHYSSDYAVEKRGVRAIVDDFLNQDAARFELAETGVVLNDEEARLRYVVQGVLNVDGLRLDGYIARFAADAIAEHVVLREAQALGWLQRDDHRLIPTPAGLAHADVLGPALYSSAVRDRMSAWTPR